MALIDDSGALDIIKFKRKSATVSWKLMFTRSMLQTSDMSEQHRILVEVSDLVVAGVLQTTLTQEDGPIKAADLQNCLQQAENGTATGKNFLVDF